MTERGVWLLMLQLIERNNATGDRGFSLPKIWGLGDGLGFFCSAPQDFGMLGVFCARFPPREASISTPKIYFGRTLS